MAGDYVTVTVSTLAGETCVLIVPAEITVAELKQHVGEAAGLRHCESAVARIELVHLFRWNPMEGQIRHGLLYSGESGLSGRLTGAVYGRQLLAKPLLKARPGENWTPEITVFGFLTTRLKT